MSGDLVWQLVKNSNSFLVKRDRAQFSREAGNLLNRNSYKFSGLANKKAIDVSVAGGRVVVGLKKKGASQKPADAFSATPLVKHMRNHRCKGAEAVKSLTAKSYYRGDLTRFAIARYHALNKSLKVNTQNKKETKRKRRGAKAAAAAAAAKKKETKA